MGVVTLSTLQARSGKGHRDENFPVASWLVHPRHRAAILAFYEFVRTADDVADHAALSPDQKLALIDGLEATLLGKDDREPVGIALRSHLAARNLAPAHALDLLTAFRMDVTKLRYRDWDDLIGYCTYSAMPVGRFVLDVHGESRAAWPANDALCAALQIINHLQDCGSDYRNLDRVYLPLDMLNESGADVQSLAASRASPALRACIVRLASRTADLLRDARSFSGMISDRRLAMEVAAIQGLAERLVALLRRRDPLSERVHLGRLGFAGFGLVGLAAAAFRRAARGFPPARRAQDA
jgi:squalene synthase HpnC